MRWFLNLLGIYRKCYKCGIGFQNKDDPAIQVCKLCELEIRAKIHDQQFMESLAAYGHTSHLRAVADNASATAPQKA